MQITPRKPCKKRDTGRSTLSISASSSNSAQAEPHISVAGLSPRPRVYMPRATAIATSTPAPMRLNSSARRFLSLFLARFAPVCSPDCLIDASPDPVFA